MQEEIVPLSYLRRYSARYPDAWRIAEEIRARRGSVNGFTAWPDWCYLPTSYVEPIVAEDRSSQTSFSLERIGDKMILAGLCAWRMGKGIYRFDPDLLEALWHTPVSGDIPGEVLLRLPEWCVYLELPDKTLGDNMRVNGCFAFLNSRLDRAELCLVAETPERRLLPAAPIVLGKTIEDGLRESMGGGLNLPSVAKIAPAIAYAASPIISLCLYLCSEEPDLAGLLPKMPERPTHPLPTKIKGGQKTFAADSARIWGTGLRLGAVLRKARESREIRGEEHSSGSRAEPDIQRPSPAPHIRRAHWHTFWTGPKNRPRKPALKWIPPIAVAFGDINADALPAVIHPVKPPNVR